MTTPGKQKRPLSKRLKIALIAFLSLLVGIAYSLLPRRPLVVCYAPLRPTDTPEPFVTCYTQPPPPTATPTPTLAPTSTPEARRLLLERLLAEGRFPQDVAHDLGS